MPSEPAKTLSGDVPKDSAHLIQVLAAYHLLEAPQQQEASALPARFPDQRRLAHELIQRGWLTPFQVNQLFQGRGAQLVLGSYIILERLGEGGMGQVFKARHHTLGRVAALKIIRKDRVSNALTVQRFRREIQAVAQLSHPNVVVAFDADQVGDTHYFAMEYVEGIDLGRLLKTQGPLPVGPARDYLRQAALGLQHAHERGLIHRDIKPSNLLLAKPQAGQPSMIKILDLGLARLERPMDSDMSSSLTNEGQLMGTPDFIAPEQARNSHRIDARADLYSLGCSFYFLLTGQLPFQSDTVTEKLYKHWFEAARPIEQLRPEVPPVLAAVIRRLMGKLPEERYQSAAALVTALDNNDAGSVPALNVNGAPQALPVAKSSAAPATQAMIPAMPALAPLTQPALPAILPVPSNAETPNPARPATLASVPHPPNRRRLFAAGGGVLGLLVLIALVMLIARPGKSQRTSPKESVDKSLTHEQQADADLQALMGRFGDRKADQDALRRDLLAYRLAYADLPVSLKAAEMVTKLPSPLDQIQGRVPPEERYENRPKNLVAVLGERRWRHWGMVRAVAMSPDARTAAGGGDDGVRFWEVKTGRELGALQAGPVQAVAYSADGKRLVTLGSDGAVTLWDLPGEKRSAPVQGPAKGAVLVFALSLDGTLAAAALENGPIKVWYASTGKELATLKAGSVVRCLAFAPDGTILASGGEDKMVRLWDIGSELERARLEGHQGSVRALTFSADGRSLASGGEDKEVRIWDLAAKKTRTTLEGHQTAITSLLFVPDEKNLAGADESGLVHLWRLAAGRQAAAFRGHTRQVIALASRGKGATLVSASFDGSLRAWDVAAEEELGPLVGHAGWAMSVAFAPDCAALASGSIDATVKLWQVPALKEKIPPMRGHVDAVRALSFSSDGQRLASGGWDGLVKLWDPSTGKEKATLSPHRGMVTSVAYALDGKTIAAGSSAIEPNPLRGKSIEVGEVKLWELPTNRERANMRSTHRSGVTGVALAANGKLGASGSRDGTVKLWDWSSGRERGTLEAGSPIESLALSPSSGTVAAGCQNGQIRVWDVATQKPTTTLTGHTSGVLGLAFSPDGHSLVSGDFEGNVIVWDLASGKPEAWKVPGPVFGVAFASDGRHVATANANSTIYIFRIKPYQSRW